jgi:hypothetical protein
VWRVHGNSDIQKASISITGWKMLGEETCGSKFFKFLLHEMKLGVQDIDTWGMSRRMHDEPALRGKCDTLCGRYAD